MSQPGEIPIENVEINYEKFKDFGNKVFEEYRNQYTEILSKLNVTHFEPFSKILMEHENSVLKGQDELTETIRQNLEQQTQLALNNFWRSNNVSEALVSLELCKEKFKPYEGHKWNMDAKTPWERTRPIRMRFKENRLRYLQAQLKFQNKRLEEVLQENIMLRKRIQDVKHERIYLMEAMGNFRKRIQLAKGEIMEFQQQILSEDYENIEPNQDKSDIK